MIEIKKVLGIKPCNGDRIAFKTQDCAYSILIEDVLRLASIIEYESNKAEVEYEHES
jgi:hypothetical protein